MLSNCKAHRIRSLFIAFLLITSCAGIIQSQLSEDGRWENGISEPWRFTEETTWQNEIRLAQLRWQEIGDENSSAEGNEWAGDYFIGGDTSGSYLRWSPQSGFVMMNVNKCAAYVENFSYGEVKVTPTAIEFHTEKTVKPSSLDKHTPYQLPTRYLPVKWRGVAYLVPEKEMGDFGDYVAGLGSYNSGLVGYSAEGSSFLYKLGVEETGTADELPTVPHGYERFIKKPIDAKITAVGTRVIKRRQNKLDEEAYYEAETPITINAGKADGVKSRMSFVVLTSGTLEEVKIRRVREHSSTGVIVRFLKEDENTPPVLWKDEESMNYLPVTVGWELSTSQFKFVPPQSPTEVSTDALPTNIH
jgi:hypothetical protein